MSSMIGSPRRVAQDVRETLQDAEFKALLFFAVVLIIVGTGFYMQAEGWDIIEAFYFCVATLTTVGYGDLHPTSDLSRLFTAAYALVGIGFILTAVTVAARRASQTLAGRVGRAKNRE
jgi:hypothetical protein